LLPDFFAIATASTGKGLLLGRGGNPPQNRENRHSRAENVRRLEALENKLQTKSGFFPGEILGGG